MTAWYSASRVMGLAFKVAAEIRWERNALPSSLDRWSNLVRLSLLNATSGLDVILRTPSKVASFLGLFRRPSRLMNLEGYFLLGCGLSSHGRTSSIIVVILLVVFWPTWQLPSCLSWGWPTSISDHDTSCIPQNSQTRLGLETSFRLRHALKFQQSVLSLILKDQVECSFRFQGLKYMQQQSLSSIPSIFTNHRSV